MQPNRLIIAKPALFRLWGLALLMPAPLILALSLSGCSTPPDEQLITSHIEAIAANIMQKKRDATLENISDSFSGKHMNTKKDVQRMLMLSFLKYKQISIILTNIRVTIDNIYTDQAEATFNAIATSSAGLIPDEGQAYRVTTQWEKIDDDWFLRKATWKRAFE